MGRDASRSPYIARSPGKSVASDTARLFFAAWPSPGIQRVLGRLARKLALECGGRPVPARNIHLTLAFLGNVPRERLPQLEELAAGIAASRFALAVDCLGYWRHNRVVWAGAGQCPEALQGLAAGLSGKLTAAGFRMEKRDYAPHVTLVRDAGRAPAQSTMPGIAWPVSDFALVESVPEGRGRAYRLLRDWPLRG